MDLGQIYTSLPNQMLGFFAYLAVWQFKTVREFSSSNSSQVIPNKLLIGS